MKNEPWNNFENFVIEKELLPLYKNATERLNLDSEGVFSDNDLIVFEKKLQRLGAKRTILTVFESQVGELEQYKKIVAELISARAKQ